MISSEEYLRDPCGASSLPLWKTEQMEIPVNITVVREDQYTALAALLIR